MYSGNRNGSSDRYLFGDEILWSAHAVPVGEREVRGILPISTLEEMENYADLLARGMLEIISLYRELGTYAFNMSVFFDKSGNDHGFRAFLFDDLPDQSQSFIHE